MIVGALPNRLDMHILANAEFLGIGKNAQRHMLPVVGVELQETKNLSSNIWRFGVRIARTLSRKQEPYDNARIAQINSSSLRKAIAVLDAGGMLVIFPDGSREGGGKWFEGVGTLVKGITDRNSAKLVFACTLDGSETDGALRLFSSVAKKLPALRIRVKLSEPMNARDLLGERSLPREVVVDNLQQQFQAFRKERE